ncbi:MAG: tRNA (adenosine(37)-N6)-dimethylallyltransferase MiaA [Desulfobulbaceae bacterium]|nr:tRNA (adenosine(37)-N6)-dimethylallyltransferase MiaA [Candidatus Kapabacteria bacterium]MBS3999732.1 tRNA (adenosine(37)-N6)-dimethylallyltransferase MiaA [Desulfobulbaceae bacterium]
MTENKTIDIPVIIGPTASGKTKTALDLAQIGPMEIVSADSRQIYKYMNIGTAKPSKEEMSLVKHHLIDFLFPNVDYSAGIFAEDALTAVNDILNRDKIPVIVGGTGFYIKAFFEGLSDEPVNESRDLVRDNLNNMLKEKGREHLYQLLKQIDPVSAEKNRDMNPQRIVRAIEFFYSFGIKFSESQESEKKHNFVPKYFGLFPQRESLYQIINSRVDSMIGSGLIDEVNYLLSLGFDLKFNSMNTVGYKEIINYLDGQTSLERAIELIKQNTRHYAKRQFTWFKKIEGVIDITNDLERFKNVFNRL